MEFKYREALNEKNECNFLEKNMITCLKEKALKDDVESRECVNENILWFLLECPTWVSKFENNNNLRQMFLNEKKLELDN